MPIGIWMVGRVAEGVGLENQKRRKSFVGSNPTPSLNLARRRNKVGHERLRGVPAHYYRWRPGSQTGRHHIARVAKWPNAADCKSVPSGSMVRLHLRACR